MCLSVILDIAMETSNEPNHMSDCKNIHKIMCHNLMLKCPCLDISCDATSTTLTYSLEFLSVLKNLIRHYWCTIIMCWEPVEYPTNSGWTPLWCPIQLNLINFISFKMGSGIKKIYPPLFSQNSI